jgi:hypothetical protein
MKNTKVNKTSKHYLVEYAGGSYDDYYNKTIFVTDKKSVAIKYVTKFNRILNEYKNYYKKFEVDQHGMEWIADEYTEYFNRWHRLHNITTCYYEEIPFR